MVIATIFFWAGRKKFVHIRPSGMGFIRQTFSGEGLSALGRLAIIYVFVAVFWSLWDQSSGGAWTLQARNMDLSFFGLQLLPEQVQTRESHSDPAVHSAGELPHLPVSRPLL